MTKPIAHDLHFAKKLGLAIAALATLLAPVFIDMLHAPAALAQVVAPAPLPAPVAVAVQAPALKPHPSKTPPFAKAPQVVVQAPKVDAQAKGAAEPQISPGTAPNEAKRIRTDWAQANLPSRAMAYAYGLFGPPNRKDSRGPVEIWDYDYLEDYQSRVTLEFSSAQSGPRITWPPQTRFEAGGQNDVAGVGLLANELGRQLHQDTSTSPRVGLPGPRAFLEPSLRLNRAERLMNLMVPTELLSGQLDLIGSITDTFGTVVVNVRDTFDTPAGTRQMTFTLLPGRYVCNLLVREASGVMYSESIPFQVLK